VPFAAVAVSVPPQGRAAGVVQEGHLHRCVKPGGGTLPNWFSGDDREGERAAAAAALAGGCTGDDQLEAGASVTAIDVVVTGVRVRWPPEA